MACIAAPGRGRTPPISPITTRNGAFPSVIRAPCSKSCCSTAFRRACRGFPSCASAKISATAFDGFDPAKIAAYDADESRKPDGRRGHHSQPRQDRRRDCFRAALPGNRGDAGLFQLSSGTLSTGGRSSIISRRWRRFRPPRPCRKTVQDLKKRGFKFCGPTIIYAFMQAVGMVNDHLVDCHRHTACQASDRGRP